MKHRVAAKGKNMYIILGLVALLLGSLVYLGMQKDTREGMTDDEEERMMKEGMGGMDMESMESMMMKEGNTGMGGMDMGQIKTMMQELEKKEKKEGMRGRR